jgi:hypothetical protein
MKSASSHILRICGLVLCLAFGLTITAQDRNREKYLISAKAGGINLVSGNVTMLRKGDERQRELASTDDLQTGDSVTTGRGGRVEVLLNPGSYMRVDENSEFELMDASLDHLQVKLVKGRAVVEVAGADGMELAIGINTPQANAVIIKGGIYRFNVLPNETTEILVRKGRVLLGGGMASEVKGGRKVIIGRGGVIEVAKLNKKEQDTLDLWSKERAETLARANRQLQRRPLLTAFNDFSWNDPYGWGRTSSYGSLGLWVYSSSTRSYCFLPLGWRAGSSPYGHSYGNGFNNGGGSNWPRDGQPTGGGSNGGNGNSGNGNGGNGNGGNGNGGNNNPSPAPQPQPSQPPSPPMERPAPVERPAREYTIQPQR